MSQILNKQFEDDLTLLVEIAEDTQTHQTFRDRITEQVLKNVEVKGFRKGKAPRNLAIQKVDQLQLEQTILEESVNKYFNELQPEIVAYLKDNDRLSANQPAALDTASIKSEDGFSFKIRLSLLPKIDLSVLDDLKVDLPTAEDYPERITFEDFQARESKSFVASFNKYETVEEETKDGYQIVANISESIGDEKPNLNKDVKLRLGSSQFPPQFEAKLLGLKAGETTKFSLNLPHGDHAHDYDFEVEVLKVEKPTYNTVSEAIEGNPEAAGQFPSEEKFIAFVKSIYDQETEQIELSAKRKKVIRALVETVPSFTLPEKQVQQEVDRIFEELKARAVASNQSLAAVFQQSGLPDSDKSLATDTQVQQALKNYVEKEFKLVEILRSVYQLKVEKKITKEELDKLSKLMKENPERYNLVKADLEEDKLLDIGYDRLLRERAYNEIVSKVKFAETKAKKSK